MDRKYRMDPDAGCPDKEQNRVALMVSGDELHGWTVFRVVGDMDLVTSPGVRQHVHDAVAKGQRRVVLDLSRVRFCDSSGIGVLIASRRLMRSCNGELRLVMPEEGAHVNRVFAALGVRRLFDIYRVLDDAVDESAEPLDLPA